MAAISMARGNIRPEIASGLPNSETPIATTMPMAIKAPSQTRL